MRQIVKYGLLTPLRPFDLPNDWSGTERVDVEFAALDHAKRPLRSNSFVAQEQAEQYAISVPSEARDVFITRTVEGNCSTRIVVHVPPNSHLTITETIRGLGALISTTSIEIGRGAAVRYQILQHLDETSLAALDYEAIGNDCELHWLSCCLGANTTQLRVATRAGHHMKVKNNSVIVGSRKQQFDVHVATIHEGFGSHSDMLTRSVLDDEARAIYHGDIVIGPDSPECDSYQKDEVILLGQRASADAIPNLVIQNNQVRCTHGATIGKLDEEKLFYFRSRGIETHAAKQLLTEGFVLPLIPQTWHELIRERISRYSQVE